MFDLIVIVVAIVAAVVVVKKFILPKVVTVKADVVADVAKVDTAVADVKKDV